MDCHKLWFGNVPFCDGGNVLTPDALAGLLHDMGLPRPVSSRVLRGTGERTDSSFAIIELAKKEELHEVLRYSGSKNTWPGGFTFLARLLSHIL